MASGVMTAPSGLRSAAFPLSLAMEIVGSLNANGDNQMMVLVPKESDENKVWALAGFK